MSADCLPSPPLPLQTAEGPGGADCLQSPSLQSVGLGLHGCGFPLSPADRQTDSADVWNSVAVPIAIKVC